MFSLLELGLKVSPVKIATKTLHVRQMSMDLLLEMQGLAEGEIPDMIKIVAACTITSAKDLTPLEPSHAIWGEFPPDVIKPLFEEIIKISQLDLEETEETEAKK